jgi:hypothetical protein
MRPIDHFFSRIISLEGSLRGPVLPPEDRSRLCQDFSRLTAPVLGAAAAEDLCYRTLDRIAREIPPHLQKLGAMAAFFLGEYDEETMSAEFESRLDREDWREIRETLEDISGEIDVNTLTTLMGELVSRGVLD